MDRLTGAFAQDTKFDAGERHDDHVRVRGTVYLWGSAGIVVNIAFNTPLLLHIRNDKSGETVTVGTETADGTQSALGTIAAGERISVQIQNIRGVYATCALETTVTLQFQGGHR